ncbi:MAG TPA: hypothetical protein VKP69_05285, partial [Isosphaeraceae bacterium]|nr:hypothetical protein [Isosphaeraceae bacterium]
MLNAAMAEPAQHEAAKIHITRRPILPNLTQLPFSPVSTVPTNGDTNPYGVAFVPNGFPSGGKLNPGDILVSNFN